MIALFSANFLAKIYVSLMVVGISIISARFLGPESRGQLAIYINIINLSAMLMGISVSDAMFHPKLEKKPLSDIFYNSISTIFLLTLFAALPISFYLRNVSDENSIILIVLVSVTTCLQILEGITRSIATKKNMVVKQNYFAMAGRTIALVLSVGICLTTKSPIGIVFGIMIGLMTSNALSIRYLNILKKPNFSLESALEIAKVSLPIHLGLVGAALLAQADQVIIGYYSSRSQIAYYQIAIKIVSLFLILPQSASNIIYIHVSKFDVSLREGLALKFFWWGIFAALAIIVIINISAGRVVETIFGNNYSQASLYLRQVSFVLFGSITMTIMGPFWVSTGAIKINSVFTFTVALVFVSVSSFFYSSLGISGVIFCLIIAYSSVVVFNAVFWLNRSKKRSILRLT